MIKLFFELQQAFNLHPVKSGAKLLKLSRHSGLQSLTELLKNLLSNYEPAEEFH